MRREVQIEEVERPWQREKEDILSAFDVDPEKGLNSDEVRDRRKQYGKNRLQSKEHKSAWAILMEQFRSIIIWLLIASAALSFAFGEWVDGSAVVAVVLINAALGFITELRAVRSMEALREMGSMEAKVLREGQLSEIEAEKLVPGDIVSVDGGDVVTADLRLIEASKLQANESALTGESVPVSKSVEALEGDMPLAERRNMLFKGTSVTRGAGKGLVVNTGMETQLGEISSLVAEAEDEATPLEERLDQLGQKLVWVTLAIITVVALAGILQGKDLLLMIETAIALAVAAVPEGLPIVATIALARGMTRMARRNALINKLTAVETLGGTDVVCTDKTGTLTENQMTVTRLVLDGGEVNIGGEGLELEGEFSRNGNRIEPQESERLRQALKVGVLCNNASVQTQDNQAVGEPVEVALLVAGIKAGLQRDELLERMPEEREVAFDPAVKMMATYHRENGNYQVAVKGAPEAVFEVCSYIQDGEERSPLNEEERQRWLDKNRELAEGGLRILGLATKQVDSADTKPYQDLIFLGLAAMHDPPREEVREAILTSKEAGVRAVMVTGDQPVTARNIAQTVGLTEEDVEAVHGNELKPPEGLSSEERERLLSAPIFARVSPKQKLHLISIHQGAGSIVAMTGDGVNDAPALKKADIGIAMGQRGTQVAREAADMVLEDDAFNTIIDAIRQGRVIFYNIRRFVLYLISCNVSEIMVVFLASLADAPLPIRPLQILFLNLVTDVFPALALGVSEGDPSVMKFPPRDPDEPVLTRRHWFELSGYSFVITVSVLGAFAMALNLLPFSLERTVTISFLTLAFAQLWHVFNMRDQGSHPLRNDVMRNFYVWGAIVFCIGLLLAAIYIPFLAQVLNVVNPGLQGWAVVLGASIIPLVVGQIWNSIRL